MRGAVAAWAWRFSAHRMMNPPMMKVLATTTGSIATTVRLSGTPLLTFAQVNGRGEITRAGGNWQLDGFAAGQYIQVVGAGVNSGSYKVETVSGTKLTLAAGQTLQAAAGVTADVLAVPTRTQNGVLTGNPALEFLPKRAAIERSSGSWLDDGFSAGMQILLGSAGGNNGTYTIAEITATRIELQESVDLAAGSATSATVTGAATFSGNVTFVPAEPAPATIFTRPRAVSTQVRMTSARSRAVRVAPSPVVPQGTMPSKWE